SSSAWTSTAGRPIRCGEPRTDLSKGRRPLRRCAPPPHKWGGGAWLERYVAVLARRPLDSFAQAQLQAAHQLAPRLARLDDVVDVAPLGGHVRVGEARRVLRDQLLAPRGRIPRAGQVAL